VLESGADSPKNRGPSCEEGDPDHVVRYEPTAANDDIDRLFVATLPGGSSQEHATFGAGVAPTRWLELNGAADLASKTKYVTFSVVIRY